MSPALKDAVVADVQLVAAPTMAQVTPVAVEFLYTVTVIVLLAVFPTATLRLANVPPTGTRVATEERLDAVPP